MQKIKTGNIGTWDSGLGTREEKTRTPNQKGFSIIELLIVMSILTILASIGITTYSGVTSRNRMKTARHIMTSFRSAMEMYKTHNGFYPLEVSVSTYTDLYNVLSPYLSGDYGRYFNTSSFSYKSSVMDVANLNVPTAYTIVARANVSDPSIITATHKSLEATLNGEKIK